MKEFDLLIIGAGPAGTPVAMEFASLNPDKNVLLVDIKGALGGECLFDGCIPSKILEVSAKHLNFFGKSSSFGIPLSVKHPKLVWKTLVSKKKQILKSRAAAAKKRLLSLGNVDLRKGAASFIDNKTVRISSEDKTSEDISFRKAVIATGTRTFVPPFEGDGVKKAWTNKEFFDKMELPKDITIVGAGPIGVELAQILSRLGVKVNLVENRENILPMVDEQFAAIILDRLRGDGVNVVLGADIKKVDFKSNSFEILYAQKNVKKKLKSSKLLFATGRTPNIELLNLEKAGVKYERKGVSVDHHLQTSNPRIYASGDVILNSPQFAHTASYEAHIISQNLFFNKNKFKTDFDKNSWVLFSDPNIVSAGISEKTAKERGIDIIIGQYDYSIDAKSQVDGNAFGFMKFVVKKKTLRIIGISILATNANAIAGEAAVIIAQRLSLKDLVDTIHPHPTLSESFSFLAKDMMGKIMKERMKSLLFKIGFLFKRWL